MNVVKISYKVAEKKGYAFHNCYDVYQVLKKRFNPLQEEFYLLPTIGQQFAVEKMFVGALDASNCDPKLLFHKLLTKYPNCGCFLIAHNHPSGNTEPSGPDIDITERLRKASDLLGYQLLDHIIFSNQGYYSFKDKGRLQG